MADFKNSYKPLDEKGYLSTSLTSIDAKPAGILQKVIVSILIVMLVLGFTFYR